MTTPWPVQGQIPRPRAAENPDPHRLETRRQAAGPQGAGGSRRRRARHREERLWRHFHKSLRFHFLFRRALGRNRLMAQLAFQEAGRRAAVQPGGRIEEIDTEGWQ